VSFLSFRLAGRSGPSHSGGWSRKEQINRYVQGWVNYFYLYNSARVFCRQRFFLEQRIRKYLQGRRQIKGIWILPLLTRDDSKRARNSKRRIQPRISLTEAEPVLYSTELPSLPYQSGYIDFFKVSIIL